MIKEFIDFLKQYGVIGLAIAVIIGGKLNALVTSLVNDLLVPLVLQPALHAANVENIQQLNFNGIFYGKVLAAGIDFVIIAYFVFLVSKIILKEPKVTKK